MFYPCRRIMGAEADRSRRAGYVPVQIDGKTTAALEGFSAVTWNDAICSIDGSLWIAAGTSFPDKTRS